MTFSRMESPHADYIDAADVPAEWLGLAVTVDVEAKAKERAVLQVMGWQRIDKA